MLVQQLWRTRKTGEDMPNEQKEAKGDAKEQRDAHSCKGQKEMKLEKKTSVLNTRYQLRNKGLELVDFSTMSSV